MDSVAPKVELVCGGKNYGENILSMAIVHELGRIPYLQAVLYVSEDGADFKPGSEVEAKVGYEEKSPSVFKGILTSVSFFMNSGTRQVTLEARDKAHEMTLGLKTALFLDKKDSEICTAIASGRGLGANVPDTSLKHAQLQQYQSTDWNFALSRLWACGLVTNVKDGTFGAVPIDELGSGTPKKIDAGKDLVLEMEIIAENNTWFDGVTVRAWDEATQKEETKKSPEVKPKLTGSFKGSGKSSQEVLIPYAVKPAALEKMGKGLLWRLRQGAVRGRIRLFGWHDVSLGDGLELKGCGAMTDGKTVIWGTRFEISAGTCVFDLQFGWDFLNGIRAQYGNEGLSNPLAGSIPIAQGLYPGKVLKLSEDPDKGERIKVHIPLMHDKGKGVWARIAAVYAGPGHAVVFRPEKDDEVLIGFLGADPAYPVILGALPSKTAPAPDSLKAKDEKNTCKGWVSKNGLTLLMDEEEKSITIQTPAGQTLAINDKEGTISLKDKNKNSLVMGRDGIKLTSSKDIILNGKNKITLESVSMELKSKNDFIVEGLNCNMQAKVGIKLKGNATAELSSSGQTVVKGGIVMLN